MNGLMLTAAHLDELRNLLHEAMLEIFNLDAPDNPVRLRLARECMRLEAMQEEADKEGRLQFNPTLVNGSRPRESEEEEKSSNKEGRVVRREHCPGDERRVCECEPRD